jgi:hypothetical protein
MDGPYRDDAIKNHLLRPGSLAGYIQIQGVPGGYLRSWKSPHKFSGFPSWLEPEQSIKAPALKTMTANPPRRIGSP